jgi:peptidoglycan/xylan/chitin deacetylase (PgdA/CDA1 family)
MTLRRAAIGPVVRRRGVHVAIVAALALVAPAASAAVAVPILAYHRFGPVVADAMTVRTTTFEAHLRHLADHARPVVSLRALVDYRRGRAPAPPPGAVVLTADDGHRSVYTEMYPLVRRFGVPVTLFVYPSAISRADYALTWEQLRELRASGLFDVQSHTWWHPNFRTEQRRLAPEAYARFVRTQLERSRAILTREVGGPVDLLSWPFGIYDRELMAMAGAAGYVAAVTIDGRPARSTDDLLALPRHLMVDGHRGAAFARLLGTDG